MQTIKCLRFIAFFFPLMISICALAQDSSKVFFTTSAGALIPVADFAGAYENSIAINSGIEYQLSKSLSMQFVLDYNAVKYNQQVKDIHSSYLFQQTSSSVFLAGFNLLKNISLAADDKLFISPYAGVGLANIGEPRLTVDNNKNIIKQTLVRMLGIYTKAGIRLAFNTGSKLLQTIYADVSYWSAGINVQESKAQAVSVLLGTRIGF